MRGKNGMNILLLSVIIFSSLLVSSVSGWPESQDTSDCINCSNSNSSVNTLQKHPIMPENIWIQRSDATKSLTKVGVSPEFKLRAFAFPSSLSLLGYIPNYDERDQGICGNCWVWGCTAPIEVANYFQNGISDRLSIQFFNSNYNGGIGPYWACCGGYETLFQNFYNEQDKFIPWSNLNADYRDGSSDCSESTSMDASSIETTENYPISSIQWHEIQTVGIPMEEAISNIKSYLASNKAVTLGFYLPDFAPFWNFWASNSGVWNPDLYCGKPNGQYPGGHEVTIVGYDDTDPSNRYWIALNSWGANNAHPDGTFKIKMDMNYGCKNSGYYSYSFGYFDVAFGGDSNSAPTNPSKPVGYELGKRGISYSYSTSTTDPNSDQLWYIFSWGDKTASTTSLVDGGFPVSISHAWKKRGTYLIKAMATDSKGATSGWSEALPVKIT